MLNSCINYLEESVVKFADKVAITDSKRSITYTQLKLEALQIARCIPEEISNRPIGIYLPKSIDCIASFMAVLYSGNFYVPLDVKSPTDRLDKVVQDLDPEIILTLLPFASNLQNLSSCKNVGLVDIEALLSDDPVEYGYRNKVDQVIDTDPIYCIYTSGSTGAQKGVVVSHRSARDFIEWTHETFDIDENTIIGNQSPVLFDVSVLDIYMCLKNGAHLYIIPEILFAFPVKLMDYVDEHKINFVIWVPSVLVNVANAKILDKKDYKHLTKILFAGEVMPNKQLNYWRESIPSALYANLYGPTEITVIACYYVVNRKFRDDESLPIGRRCDNADLIVLTNDNQETSENETGELCVRGTLLALGYWNDHAKTESVFVQNPLNKNYSEKIYRTGDLVKYNELGELIYVGRKDSQIKHMGYRIELGDIENAVSGINGIDNSCVLYDQRESEITLFYKAKNKEIDQLTITTKLMKSLPKYMLPTRFVKLDELPENTNGKIDRPKLRSIYLN